MLLITIKGYRVALPLYFDLKKTALQLEVFMILLIVMHVNLVSNTCIHVPSNLTECSTIQGGIGLVISKLDEHACSTRLIWNYEHNNYDYLNYMTQGPITN